MVDSDPQTNLTMCFMKELEEGSNTLYTLYQNKADVKDVIINIKPGLDIIPGDFELCSADLEFFKRAGALKSLQNALKPLQRKYDYIIIDTPPNMGFLSLNAFMASNFIITPMSAESFSLQAVRILRRVINEVESEAERKIKVAGVLLTKYNPRTNLSKQLEDTLQSAASLLGTTLFESRIRTAVSVPESQIVKVPLFDYAPRSEVAKDHEKFIDELLERIG